MKGIMMVVATTTGVVAKMVPMIPEVKIIMKKSTPNGGKVIEVVLMNVMIVAAVMAVMVAMTASFGTKPPR